jgi:hypothetical protein
VDLDILVSNMNEQYTYERVGDVFIYSMITPPTFLYKTNNNLDIIKEFVDKKTLKVNIKIPTKKIVICGDDIIDYDKALNIMNFYYIKEHTLEIDDVDKFEETHEKGFNLLKNVHINNISKQVQ